jgi:hypothetical protein
MNQNELYAIADTLQLELRLVKRRLSGKARKQIYPELGQAVHPEIEVVSSVCPFSGAGVMVRVMGKLGLFVGCSGSGPTEMQSVLLVLDLSKLPSYGVGFFENLKEKPDTMQNAMAALAKSIRVSFRRLGAQSWKQNWKATANTVYE